MFAAMCLQERAGFTSQQCDEILHEILEGSDVGSQCPREAAAEKAITRRFRHLYFFPRIIKNYPRNLQKCEAGTWRRRISIEMTGVGVFAAE